MVRNPRWRRTRAVVVLQAIVIVIEFIRRDRLQTLFCKRLLAVIHRLTEKETEQLPDLRALTFLEREMRKAESHVLIAAVLLAMTGEILHGFGDILTEVLFN